MSKKVKIIVCVLVIIVAILIAIFVIPKIIENQKFEEKFKANLNMLLEAKIDEENEYKVEINNKENLDYDAPLTFTIEKIYTEGENWKSTDYKIVPSYNKDFSKWTKADKEAYNKICKQANAMSRADYEAAAQEERNKIYEIQKELNEQMAND